MLRYTLPVQKKDNLDSKCSWIHWGIHSHLTSDCRILDSESSDLQLSNPRLALSFTGMWSTRPLSCCFCCFKRNCAFFSGKCTLGVRVFVGDFGSWKLRICWRVREYLTSYCLVLEFSTLRKPLRFCCVVHLFEQVLYRIFPVISYIFLLAPLFCK